jgi:AcrR family transcriptional regulator
LPLTVRSFNTSYVRLDEDDRRTSAVIRDAAMALFAERGVAGVTVREVAAAAGVSPGLVMHHFGSKAGLKEAVDRRVARFVDELLADLALLPEDSHSGSVVDVFAVRLREEVALVGYLQRLLVDGGLAADELFQRLFEVSLAGVRALTAGGVMRAAPDERLRAALLLVNDLAGVVLRDRVERVLGWDPLAADGLVRWTAELMDIYTLGVFALPSAAPPEPARGQRTPR